MKFSSYRVYSYFKSSSNEMKSKTGLGNLSSVIVPFNITIVILLLNVCLVNIINVKPLVTDMFEES